MIAGRRPGRMRAGLLLAGLALAVLIIALIIGVVTALPSPRLSPALAQRQADALHGEALARIGDCAGCHSATEAAPMAGGRPLATPLGVIYSSNITPDREHGIGGYSLIDFVRAMRFGVAPDGRRLSPAMPYTAYAQVKDEDLQDLLAYLQQRVAPSSQPNRPDDAPWPLTLRWPVALWNLVFLDPHPFQPTADSDALVNRGAYLVQGLGHCGSCHTPRGWALQERGGRASDPLFLSGTAFAGGAPINLRGNDGDGLGRWSVADIVTLLQSGRNGHSAASGAMAEVIGDSTQYVGADDLTAMAVYLKSLAPAPDAGRARFAADDGTRLAFLSGRMTDPGGRLYQDSCAACHRISGAGGGTAFPDLAGNASVLSQDPASLIAVILDGSRRPSTAQSPSALAMPGFAWRYDDQDIARLASFVRASWGNHAAPVSADQVRRLRRAAG